MYNKQIGLLYDIMNSSYTEKKKKKSGNRFLQIESACMSWTTVTLVHHAERKRKDAIVSGLSMFMSIYIVNITAFV